MYHTIKAAVDLLTGFVLYSVAVFHRLHVTICPVPQYPHCPFLYMYIFYNTNLQIKTLAEIDFGRVSNYSMSKNPKHMASNSAWNCTKR